MAACWGVWLELVLLSNSSLPHEPIPYLDTLTGEAFGNKDLMCQCEKPGCPHFFSAADQNYIWNFEFTFESSFEISC